MKHDWRMAQKALGVLLALNFLVACSVSTDVGDPIPAPPADKFAGKLRVDGPVVEGVWATACVKDYYQSKQWSLSFTGDKFIRTQEVFSDQFCQKSKDKKTYTGVFIFTQTYVDGSYGIDYAIDLGNGWTQFADEKIYVENGLLYISNFVSGETAPLERSMVMTKQGANGPAPTPATCQNYTGQYQMNNELFEIDQKDCQKIVWSYVPNYSNPNGKTTTYIADGVERVYDSRIMKVSFDKGLLKRGYQQAGRQIVEVWSFKKSPCYLANPSGENYLTRDVWIDGQVSSQDCSYFAKVK